MGYFVRETFTDADDTLLQSHTGELGATWTKHPSYTGDTAITSNRARAGSGTTYAVYYSSGTTPGADYDVLGDFRVVTATAGSAFDEVGLMGRMDTTADTYYAAYHVPGNTDEWWLYKGVAGVFTQLGTYAQALSASTTYAGKLEMRGSAIKFYVDGVERISVTDSAITAAGKAGLQTVDTSATTGIHLDNYFATDGRYGFPFRHPAATNANLRR
jgi:hypothetical protein